LHLMRLNDRKAFWTSRTPVSKRRRSPDSR